jgi:hypothetical protein
MSELERSVDNWMTHYHKSSEHIQGCMIEGLSQDLNRNNDDNSVFVCEVLRRLAADLK